MTDRQLTVAGLAARCRIPRGQLKRALSGHKSMTVDELLTIIPALKLTPEELLAHGLVSPNVDVPPSEDASPATSDDQHAIDMWGNHTEQIFKLAFGLGVDILFVCDSTQLTDSNIPKNVIDAQKGKALSLSLDAAYHRFNKPQYSDTHLTLTLSFDELRTVDIPWAAIQRVMLSPEPPTPKVPPKSEPSPLRLIR